MRSPRSQFRMHARTDNRHLHSTFASGFTTGPQHSDSAFSPKITGSRSACAINIWRFLLRSQSAFNIWRLGILWWSKSAFHICVEGSNQAGHIDIVHPQPEIHTPGFETPPSALLLCYKKFCYRCGVNSMELECNKIPVRMMRLWARCGITNNVILIPRKCGRAEINLIRT